MSRYSLPTTYLLFVGSIDPRKNLHFLLQVWDRLHPDFPGRWLVVAGGSNPIFRGPPPRQDTEGASFLGRVPEADLPALYSGAAAVVIPSVYEGFGLPVIESMACGAPVICSRAGALAETAGGAALLFDPLDRDGLAAAIRHVLVDPSEREALRRKGFERAATFPWTETAVRVRTVLEEVAAHGD
jgi:alpha-1,3-rhamnosyl/mannosyltransferase